MGGVLHTSSMLKSHLQGILPLDVRSTAACQGGEWSPSQAKAIARSGIPAVVRREHNSINNSHENMFMCYI